MSSTEHEQLARDTAVRCAVITVSDTRTEETDKSGQLIENLLAVAGHATSRKLIVRDEPAQIGALLDELSADADVILMNGGTGIAKRDSTWEAVAAKLEKTLPGFGEIFRMLSFEEIGPAAMLSRAIAGVYRDTIVFSMPGSANAVQLAMDKLIVPQLQHLVWEILRQNPDQAVKVS